MSSLALEYYPISTRISGTGSSTEAKAVGEKLKRVVRELKSSSQKKVFNELEELSVDASSKNWDGLGSLPLDGATYQVAKRFILALPTVLPMPELTVDRDGEINFDWFGSSGQIFSVSLRHDGRLVYAGQFAPRKSVSGKEEFNDAVPKEVIRWVEFLCT